MGQDGVVGSGRMTKSEDASRYRSIDDAAARLATTPNALRARCRRNARREGRTISAHLGGGIVAIKLGVSWRIRFPD